MKIKTRFSTNDKVWYYRERENAYSWGKIVSLDVSVRCGQVDRIEYHIKNRFYQPDYCRMFRYREDWRDYGDYLTKIEEEVFISPEELKDWLEKEHRVKMDGLKELKKGCL